MNQPTTNAGRDPHMPDSSQSTPTQNDHRARAERLLTEAPQAGSMNHGQVEALAGIGFALLALGDQLAATTREEGGSA